MDFDDVARIGCELPEVTVSTSYGTPSLKVRTKSFCRTWGPDENERKGPVDGEVLVVFTESIEDKEAWLAMHPDVLFDQDHYRGHAAMLVRLAIAGEDVLADVLEHSYRQKAPKTLIRRLDEDADR